jgi:hypothetical protein
MVSKKKYIYTINDDCFVSSIYSCSRFHDQCPQRRHFLLTIEWVDGFVRARVQVAKDPTGKDIDALAQHIKNLLCPSTPLFFNTLYDPYAEGADFVRGYPFRLGMSIWVRYPIPVGYPVWVRR